MVVAQDLGLVARMPDHRVADAWAAIESTGARDLDAHRRLWAENPEHRYEEVDRATDPDGSPSR